ncbi:MAG: hypothetical protein PWP52_2349 [Bacteroidales bacterium]|nr:hypothetical protein [Bacteroidales bacterium]
MPRKKSQSPYKKVIVKWEDACVWNSGPLTYDEVLKVKQPVRETSGYLIHKDKRRVIIVSLYDHDDKEFDVITFIPRQWVLEINELK